MTKTNALRQQVRRQIRARKKLTSSVAKPPVMKGPAPRKLKIRA